MTLISLDLRERNESAHLLILGLRLGLLLGAPAPEIERHHGPLPGEGDGLSRHREVRRGGPQPLPSL